MRSRGTAASAPPQSFQPSDTPSASSRGSDYAQLSRQIRQAGLMERQSGRYAWRITVTAILLAAGWAAFVLVGDTWWQLAVAVFLAVVFTQAGFLGHDAGHRQISGSRRGQRVLVLLMRDLRVRTSCVAWS